MQTGGREGRAAGLPFPIAPEKFCTGAARETTRSLPCHTARKVIRMKRRLIFFRGLIATLDLYTEEFVKIFTAHGAECLVLDAAHMDGEMLRLKAFLLSEVTAAISCNNIGLHLEFEDGKNIWDRFQIPFYNIMMDHPFHYKNALDAAPEQMALL